MLGFLANAHLARVLDTDGFGVVVIGFAFLSYALWFADLGLGTLGTREAGRGADQREFAPGEILLTRILLSAVVFVLSQVLALAVYPDALLRWVVSGFLLCIIAYGISIEWYYQGVRRYLPLVISRILAAALYFLALYLFVKNPGDVTRVPIYYFAGTLIPALVLFGLRREKGALQWGRWSLRSSVEIMRRSSFIGFGGIFAQSVQLLPPLALGWFYSTSEVGILGAALRVVSILLIVDRIFAALFLPAISRQWATEREKAIENLRRVLGLVIITGFSLGTLATVYARPVITLIFGPSYAGGADTLAILSWFAAITLINSVFSFGLIGTGNERGYLRATVMGGILSVIFIIAMIYLWGLPGAAIAMVAGEMCIVGLTYSQFRRTMPIAFGRPLMVAVGVSAAVLAGAHLLGTAELWQAPLAAIAFFGLAFLFGGIRRKDITWLMGR